MQAVLESLRLPPQALLQRRLAKSLLRQQLPLTQEERNLLDTPHLLQEVQWWACVSEHTVHVPPLQTPKAHYEELQVFAVRMPDEQLERYAHKVARLLQRHIPYHLLLVIGSERRCCLQLAEKELHPTDAQKRLPTEELQTTWIELQDPAPQHLEFLQALAFERQGKQHLQQLFRSYYGLLLGLRQAEKVGTPVQTIDAQAQHARQQLLERLQALQQQQQRLAQQATKEKQQARRAELNMQYKALGHEEQALRQALQASPKEI